MRSFSNPIFTLITFLRPTRFIVGLLLLALTLYKVVERWKLSGRTRNDLFTAIIKDQIISYIAWVLGQALVYHREVKLASNRLLVITSVVIGSWRILLNAKVNTIRPSAVLSYIVFYSLIMGNPSILCLLGGRMFLSLKEICDSEIKVEEGTSITFELSTFRVTGTRQSSCM